MDVQKRCAAKDIIGNWAAVGGSGSVLRVDISRGLPTDFVVVDEVESFRSWAFWVAVIL